MIIEHRTPSGDAAAEARVDSALAFYACFEAGGEHALAKTVSEDWIVDPPAPGGPPGIAGYAPLLQDFRNAFPDCVVRIEDAFCAADRVVVRCTMQATHRAPFLGVPATGRAIVLRTCDIHRIGNDHRIAQSWHIEDLLGFLEKAGALSSSH